MQVVIDESEIFDIKEAEVDKSGKVYISNKLAGKRVKIIILKPKQ